MDSITVSSITTQFVLLGVSTLGVCGAGAGTGGGAVVASGAKFAKMNGHCKDDDSSFNDIHDC